MTLDKIFNLFGPKITQESGLLEPPLKVIYFAMRMILTPFIWGPYFTHLQKQFQPA